MPNFLIAAVIAAVLPDVPTWPEAEAEAAKYTVAVLRALTTCYPPDSNMPMSVLRAFADEIEAEGPSGE